MIRLEFLLEEPSMENVLKVILPKILPADFQLNKNYFLRPHSGKSDLRKSIPVKMRAFSRFHEPVLLIILHDQHSHDCVELKNRLTQLCKEGGDCPFLIRIVCRELESWYLGDMDAIESVYPKFKSKKYKNKAKFRNPDRCDASHELSKILPKFKKLTASKTIPHYFTINQNNSTSFNHFVVGLKKFVAKYLEINNDNFQH